VGLDLRDRSKGRPANRESPWHRACETGNRGKRQTGICRQIEVGITQRVLSRVETIRGGWNGKEKGDSKRSNRWHGSYRRELGSAAARAWSQCCSEHKSAATARNRLIYRSTGDSVEAVCGSTPLCNWLEIALHGSDARQSGLQASQNSLRLNWPSRI